MSDGPHTMFSPRMRTTMATAGLGLVGLGQPLGWLVFTVAAVDDAAA